MTNCTMTNMVILQMNVNTNLHCLNCTGEGFIATAVNKELN